MYQLDGYTTQTTKDWLSAHAHLIPSESIWLRAYTNIDDVQIPYQEPQPEYTPRPSLVKHLGGQIDYAQILSQFELNERELKVMRCIFVENLTQEETSDILDCSQSLVSLILKSILSKMRGRLVN